MKLKRTVLAVALIASMFLTILPASALEADPRSEEVIYAVLTADGEVERTYAVVAISANGESVHYGNFLDIKNLNDTTPIRYENGKVIVDSGSKRFYYQGELSNTELPWQVKVEYKLDGKIVSPEVLAGQSGELEVCISTRKNPSVDEVFFKNYMMQVTVTLDASLCSDIEAPGASVASAGGNKAIVFAVLPGSEGDMNLSANVRDFCMDGITMAAVPYDVSSALGDADNITADLTRLTDAISKLSGGARSLANGAASLNNGAVSYGTGISEISSSSEQIISGSEQIGSALSYIACELSGEGGAAGSNEMEELMQLPAGLRQVADGLRQTSGGITQLYEGYSVAYPTLSQTISAIPEPTQEDIVALMELAPGNLALAALIQNYQAAQTVKGVWAQTQLAFEAVNENLPALAGGVSTMARALESIASQIELSMSPSDGISQLEALAEAMGELSERYESFHEGLVDYTGGVDQLAVGWASIEEGTLDIRSGAGSLSSGLSKLNQEAGKIPQQIEELLGSSDEDGFEVRSFLDERNEDIASVQFVLTTKSIELPEYESESESEPAAQEESIFIVIWKRFIALFS